MVYKSLDTSPEYRRFSSVAADYNIRLLGRRAARDAEGIFNPGAYLAGINSSSSYMPLAVVDSSAFGQGEKEFVIFGRQEIGYETNPELPEDFRERAEHMGYREGQDVWFRKEKAVEGE